jgi:hypothetical protein
MCAPYDHRAVEHRDLEKGLPGSVANETDEAPVAVGQDGINAGCVTEPSTQRTPLASIR